VIGLGGNGPVLNNLGTGDTCSVSRIAEIVIEESGLEGVSIDFLVARGAGQGTFPRPTLM
jgi:hypothetical protein